MRLNNALDKREIWGQDELELGASMNLCRSNVLKFDLPSDQYVPRATINRMMLHEYKPMVRLRK